MADIFEVKIVGLQELILKLQGEADGAMHSRIVDAIQFETKQLEVQVRQNITTLFQNPEVMQAAISSQVEDSANEISGTVTAAGLPYLKALEYGVTTKPHDIYPVNASVLAFMAGSTNLSGGPKSTEMIFTKHVSHPGSVIPEFAFMRRALVTKKADIILSIQKAAAMP